MNNPPKILIPEENKFCLKPKETLVINKFLPFGIKLERNTLNSGYLESKKIFVILIIDLLTPHIEL